MFEKYRKTQIILLLLISKKISVCFLVVLLMAKYSQNQGIWYRYIAFEMK